jgi:hypothetical protein
MEISIQPSALAVTSLAQQNVDLQQWHIRLAHASTTVLRQLGLRGDFNSATCEVCILTKMLNLPHQHLTRATSPLEIVSMDTWGPQLVDDQKVYFLTITCMNTKIREVYPLRDKSSTTINSAFLSYKAAMELQSGNQIKAVRCDVGKEFLGEVIKTLNQFGIRYESTAPYSPESNGLAERQNGTLMNTVRSILKQANMPFDFGNRHSRLQIIFAIDSHIKV